MTRLIFNTEEEAREAAEWNGKPYYPGIADDYSGLESGTGFNKIWSGIVCCFKTDDGDIFAWWD